MFLNKLETLPYLFPQLKEEKIYLSIGLDKKKKETISEISNLNIFFDQSSFIQQNLIENRFWLYENCNNLDENDYNYNFKLIDLSTKTFVFDSTHPKAISSNSLLYLYNLRKSILLNTKNSMIIKNRMLALNKRGYKLSCFGNQALLSRNFFFNKNKKLKNFLYSSWYISNINSLGTLNFFNLKKWELKKITDFKKPKISSFIKKYKFYYKKNSSLKSFITLEKNKLRYD